MPDHVESMRKEVAAHDRASFFKLHNLAGDRCKSRNAMLLPTASLESYTRECTRISECYRHLSVFSYMQVGWHMPGITTLFGSCSSAPQLSGTSALTCESQRSSLTLRWAGMPFFKLL